MQRQPVEGGFEQTSVAKESAVQPPSRRWRVLPAAFALSAALIVVAVCSSKMMHMASHVSCIKSRSESRCCQCCSRVYALPLRQPENVAEA